MITEEKRKKIKESISNTKKRHNDMDLKTYEIKIIDSKLNKDQRSIINHMFCEAKWLRNFHISNNINKKYRNTHTVEIKVKDHFEKREISYLGSQMIQDVFDNLKSEIKGLKTKKSKNDKVGKLKYKSFCNVLSLRQYGTTYSIKNKNHIKVQNIKKPLYVRGLKQIPDNSDITNAKLVRKVSGLYLYITCFIPKVNTGNNKKIGIDFGIEHNLNLSDGNIYDVKLDINKMIKIYSKKLNRSYIRNGKVKSKNHFKRSYLLRKAYHKQNNRKYDIANKILHELNDYSLIAIQDEMIKNWQKGLFGKQIQKSCMGVIKRRLKEKDKTIVISRSYPSTQICPICGSLNKHPLNKRDYDCPNCGYHHDSRDIKSAQSILDYALSIS